MDKRVAILDNIVISGTWGSIAGFKERLEAELKLRLPQSDFISEDQPKNIQFGTFPEFLAGLGGQPRYAAWLGASIVAKVCFLQFIDCQMVFPDTKNFVTKADYNETGPAIVRTHCY